MFDTVDEQAVNTLRMLSIDEIQAANSGHPGLPLDAAPMLYALWTRHLNVNPVTSRKWPNRDRFILSAGHGSALLYSLLHCSGYKVSRSDLMHFRQLGSVTPGHPEVGKTDGVEATTGPLGQGLGMSIGMAMAEAHIAAIYNKPNFPIMDHFTYTLCGDGDLMEGISDEASSLAGHLKLGKLIVLYDSNDVSLDGPTTKAFTENVKMRFEGYGWQYLSVKDGNDLEAISTAIDQAKLESNKPTIIEVKTVIGYGAPGQGTNKVHGTPLGEKGIETVAKNLGWKLPPFSVPSTVAARFSATIKKRGIEREAKWREMFKAYSAEYSQLAEDFSKAFINELPVEWYKNLPQYQEGESQASRSSSKDVLQILAQHIPWFWGGSADLSSSNNTRITKEIDFSSTSYEGRNIWFGVREFGMAAAMNGIQLHGGSRVYGGTFFVFADYLRPALRLSALQKVPVTYVLTHDSVAVGEDGPTHEPVEQLASIRAIPNVTVIRPADGNETRAAWIVAASSTHTPTVLVLSRQKLPVLPGTGKKADESVRKGGYVLSPQLGEKPSGILIASGSEVALAYQAQKTLREQGIDVSVVSMPSFELFLKQDETYRESVLPKHVRKRVSIEAASTFGWQKFVGTEGKSIGVDQFGLSGNGEKILEKFGITVKNVVDTFKSLDIIEH